MIVTHLIYNTYYVKLYKFSLLRGKYSIITIMKVSRNLNGINKLFPFSTILNNFNRSESSTLIYGIFQITLLSVTEPIVVVAFSILLSKEVKSELLLVKINSIRESINIFLKSSKVNLTSNFMVYKH